MKIDHISICGVSVSVLREDLNHPVVQGNKLRKLKYHLIEAKTQGAKTLVTFGGAYSNHLVATAFAASEAGFECLGVVRGDELANQPDKWSKTLHDSVSYGMKLLFVSRADYRLKTDAKSVEHELSKLKKSYVIQEGGSGEMAVRGVAELVDDLAALKKQPSHIFCPVGTGGTLAGVITGVAEHKWSCQVVGTVVLKGLHSVKSDIVQWLGDGVSQSCWHLLDDYHFGGYAKHTSELIEFCLKFEAKHLIKLDKIYNAKSFFALNDLIQKGEITTQDRPLIIHTGGLQGGTFGAHN